MTKTKIKQAVYVSGSFGAPRRTLDVLQIHPNGKVDLGIFSEDGNHVLDIGHCQPSPNPVPGQCLPLFDYDFARCGK